jgi:hypothetical protein
MVELSEKNGYTRPYGEQGEKSCVDVEMVLIST